MQPGNADILIVGAGVSGIGVACRLTRRFPDQRVVILECRASIGGTWDLFRYPGIRSDSDMFTYSYEFRPCDRADILAGAGTIRAYVAETAAEFGVRERIRLGRSVLSADWNSRNGGPRDYRAALTVVLLLGAEARHPVRIARRTGDASIHTGEIDTFTASGPRLQSGEAFDADIVVSATGFDLQALGGIAVSVDGQDFSPSERMICKGTLVEGVPNLGIVFGYVNFTWTAKVELVGNYLCQLFEHMETNGAQVAIPRDDGDHALESSIISELSSGYVRRGAGRLPRQGRALGRVARLSHRSPAVADRACR